MSLMKVNVRVYHEGQEYFGASPDLPANQVEAYVLGMIKDSQEGLGMLLTYQDCISHIPAVVAKHAVIQFFLVDAAVQNSPKPIWSSVWGFHVR
jgi:hypothetical protein